MSEKERERRDKASDSSRYLLDYTDRRTLKFMAYNCGAVCIFFWFLYNYTTIFQDIQDVLLGKK